MQQKITDEQIRTELESGQSATKIAKKYDMSERVVHIRIAKLKASGYDPENGRYHKNPTDHVVSGYSTLERLKLKDDPTVGRVLEWVKTNRSITEQLDSARIVMESIAADIKPCKEVVYHGEAIDKHKFSVIPLGDPHIGLMTWAKEVGHDWDLKIAQRVYRKVFTRLLARSPDTEECVLLNTGDFFHADNIAGETTASGHKLDLDGRPSKWLEVGFRILQMFIEMCLTKYKRVKFYNVPGNHDDILGAALGVYADILYENNPRIEVFKGQSPFQYYHNGEVLLGFAHGHKCKLAALPGKMADDMYKLWGITTHRHWITGHVHHNQWIQYKEWSGASVESVGIIPPKDAYAYGGGFGGRRGTQLIVFDNRIGEWDRKRESVLTTD
jgi:transposase